MASKAAERRLDVEDFLFHEAELLDNWRLPEWTELYSNDARYEIASLSSIDTPASAASPPWRCRAS